MVTIKIPGHRFPSIKLVIFDKDGTLMELHHYWSEMCTLRADSISDELALSSDQKTHLLYAMGVDSKNRRLLPDGPVGIKKREIVMQAAIEYLASIGFMKTDDLCFRVFEEVDRISMDILDKLVIPIPGATELVNTLSRFECKIAIATTDRSYRATLALKALGLNEKVDLIVGADCVSETKPNPEMIYYILDKLNVEKRHALMVGDAITDVDMGGRAGLSGTIGVLTGQTPKEILKKSTPHIIESVSQIDVIQDDS